MGKHRTKQEWISLFKEYEITGSIPPVYFEGVKIYKEVSTAKHKRHRTLIRRIKQASDRFKYKYNEWKMLDNIFMENKSEKRGRKPKRDIEGFVRGLSREQLEELARIHIEQNEKKHNKDAKYGCFSKKEIAFILNVHRTTLYKKSKERVYIFDKYKEEIIQAFYENKTIYGRRKLSIYLSKQGILINERTLGRYLVRYGLETKTRRAKMKSESKNTNVKCTDLVKRNYNPKEDNIIATDVSYIPANEPENNVYLSVAISHKTKLIESFEVSKSNNTKLVVETIKKLNRKKYIIHSDHGTQYSAWETIELLKEQKAKRSMSRIGNSLDNREVEYFFGCLKGEFLNHINTHTMKMEDIVKLIDEYITWYNTKRIQKRLQWKTPAEASAYAI